jgi:hypothetical protein
VTDPDSLSAQSPPAEPLVITESGSPENGPKSNIAGRVDVCEIWMPDVCVGN